MNAIEALDNSHQLVLQTLEDLPETQWDIVGVSGDWSVKDILAYLTSHEQGIVDLLLTFQGEKPSAYLLSLLQTQGDFEQAMVERREYQTAQQVLMAYHDLQVQSTSLLATIPVAVMQQKGTMPWYNANVSLEDVLNQFAKQVQHYCEKIVQFREKQHV